MIIILKSKDGDKLGYIPMTLWETIKFAKSIKVNNQVITIDFLTQNFEIVDVIDYIPRGLTPIFKRVSYGS